MTDFIINFMAGGISGAVAKTVCSTDGGGDWLLNPTTQTDQLTLSLSLLHRPLLPLSVSSF